MNNLETVNTKGRKFVVINCVVYTERKFDNDNKLISIELRGLLGNVFNSNEHFTLYSHL